MQLVWAISTLIALGVVAQSPATTTASPMDIAIPSTTAPLTQESALDGLTTDDDLRHPGGGDDDRHHEYDSGDPRSSRGLYASRMFVDGGDIGYGSHRYHEGRPGYGYIGGHDDGGHNGYYGSNDGYKSHRNNRGYYRV